MTTESVQNVGGRATRIVRSGRGAPLLWLHDTSGNRWTRGHDALVQHHEVIAPSLPGFDDSATLGRIDGPEDVVFWLLDLWDALGLERPVLLGCGLGGWIAAEFAARYPDRLGRLVLVDAYGLQVEGALAADEFALTPPMLRPLVFAQPEASLAREWLPDAEPPERMESALHARVAAARLAWQFPYCPKLGDRLARAKVPALILWGAQDRPRPSGSRACLRSQPARRARRHSPRRRSLPLAGDAGPLCRGGRALSGRGLRLTGAAPVVVYDQRGAAITARQ